MSAWDGRHPAGPVLGCMTWGYEAQVGEDEAAEMLAIYIAGCEELGYEPILDTARTYQAGQSEEIIGKLLKQEGKPWSGKNVKVHTKANHFVCPLTKEGTRKQCEDSLKALQMDCLDVFYLHMPDMTVDIEETLEACNDLYEEGKFKELGISNFASWDVYRCVMICRQNGWVEPTVYQGVYNPISRSICSELLPCVRTLGIRVYTFNPLAGGLMTGRYNTMDDITKATEGRFSTEFDYVPRSMKLPLSGMGHKIYRARFGKEEILDAIVLLNDTMGAENMVEKTFSWMRHTSYLSGDDGIIFGASKAHHVEGNIDAFVKSAPLSEEENSAFDKACQLSKSGEESYLRSYGRVPGDCEIYMSRFKLKN